jgi:hypothetical protein
MSLAVEAPLILLVACVALINGIRFRRGSGPRIYLRWYRDPQLPAVWRNSLAMEPFVTSLLLPPLVLLTTFAFGAGSLIGPLPDRIVGLIFFGGFGWFFLAMGIGILISYRPPARLMPRWLVGDDERVGYRPASAGRFDKLLVIVLGIPAIVGGCLMAIVALGFAFGAIRRVAS